MTCSVAIHVGERTNIWRSNTDAGNISIEVSEKTITRVWIMRHTALTVGNVGDDFGSPMPL